MSTVKDEGKGLLLNKAEENIIEDYDSLSVANLPPKIQRFIHLYLTGQYSSAKIADLLDVHPNTIYRWLKRDDVREVMDEMQNITHRMVGLQIKSLTVKATERLYDLMDSPIDGVALQAVKDILDRGGHKPEQKIKVDKTVRTFEEKLRDIIDVTIGDYEDVEDVEYEDVEDDAVEEC